MLFVDLFNTNQMFKAFIDPYTLSMDVALPQRQEMVVRFIQIEFNRSTRVIFNLAPGQNMVVHTDKAPTEHRFRLVSDMGDEIQLGFGFRHSAYTATYQFNFVIYYAERVVWAIRNYNYTFDRVDNPRDGRALSTGNELVDKRFKLMEGSPYADMYDRAKSKDNWEPFTGPCPLATLGE